MPDFTSMTGGGFYVLSPPHGLASQLRNKTYE